MFSTTKIPADTLAAHSSAAISFYAPRIRGRAAPRRAASAALNFAVLTAKDAKVTAEERFAAARQLVKAGVAFSVRLAGRTMGVSSDEIIVGSSSFTVGMLCDGNATFRPRLGSDGYFALDKRTMRVETWQWTGRDGLCLALITIDEQRAGV